VNGFVRTLAFGLAALCVVLIAGTVTVVRVLKDKVDHRLLREVMLSPEEKSYLAAMGKRAAEPPPAGPERTEKEDDVLARVAELAAAEQANRLVAELRRSRQSQDERQSWLDQQWAEYQLAKGDLLRLQRQVESRQQQHQELVKTQAAEHARWAAAQVEEAKRVTTMREVEMNRYKDQTKVFEAMKDAAWPSLRRFPPRDIARYLALMDGKKAARLLVLAEQDADYPGVTLAIHKEMLHLDLEGITGDHAERLARLYSFMPADAVLPSLRDATAQEIADILVAMERVGQPKKRAEILEALRKDNSKREMDVQRLLTEVAKPAATANGR